LSETKGNVLTELSSRLLLQRESAQRRHVIKVRP